MNQVTKMFMDSNKRMNGIMGGNFSATQISHAQREFEGQIKLINAVVSVYAVASKNKRALQGLDKMNLLDETTAIEIFQDKENDSVKCPELGTMLTRSECLDYSGEHYDDCSGCDTGKDNKNRLLGPVNGGA